MIQLKRVYEPAVPVDYARFLVERLWARGLRKEVLAMEDWLKEAAPSTELRKWFGHVSLVHVAGKLFLSIGENKVPLTLLGRPV